MASTLMYYKSDVSGLLPGFSSHIKFTTGLPVLKPLEKVQNIVMGLNLKLYFRDLM